MEILPAKLYNLKLAAQQEIFNSKQLLVEDSRRLEIIPVYGDGEDPICDRCLNQTQSLNYSILPSYLISLTLLFLWERKRYCLV